MSWSIQPVNADAPKIAMADPAIPRISEQQLYELYEFVPHAPTPGQASTTYAGSNDAEAVWAANSLSELR